jgi:hypothetical protein
VSTKPTTETATNSPAVSISEKANTKPVKKTIAKSQLITEESSVDVSVKTIKPIKPTKVKANATVKPKKSSKTALTEAELANKELDELIEASVKALSEPSKTG